jgi:hypothetical protein
MTSWPEVWRDVPGYAGLYQVSNLGRVYSRGHLLKPWAHNLGYSCVTLFRDRKAEKKLVHRLVAEAFLPNPAGLPQVNHKNGNKMDNRVENLEWCTNQENALHNAYVLGKDSNMPKRSVVCLTTGEKYASVTLAAKSCGGNSQNISKVCQGKRKHHKGLAWAYAEEVTE